MRNQVCEGQLALFDLPVPEGPARTSVTVLRPRKRPVRRPDVTEDALTQLALFEELLATPEEQIEVKAWTDDDVVSLREFMLWRHVHYVMDKRTSEATLRETWEWILSDVVAPFSFRVCLDSVLRQTGNVVEGRDDVVTIDADEIREQIFGYAQYYGTWREFCLVTHRP